jgi:hypothetical protein
MKWGLFSRVESVGRVKEIKIVQMWHNGLGERRLKNTQSLQTGGTALLALCATTRKDTAWIPTAKAHVDEQFKWQVNHRYHIRKSRQPPHVRSGQVSGLGRELSKGRDARDRHRTQAQIEPKHRQHRLHSSKQPARKHGDGSGLAVSRAQAGGRQFF